MHRVELKLFRLAIGVHLFASVPNAPCGVEIPAPRRGEVILTLPVPNAPCGVEIRHGHQERFISLITLFLMHRVELK